MVAGVFALLGCNAEPTSQQDCGECGVGASCDVAVGECYCDVGYFGDPRSGCTAHGDMCGEAEQRVGHSACRHVIEDESVWSVLSIGHANDAAVRRAVKYLVPAVPDARLPVVFGDTNWYRSHHCLLAQGFEPLFVGLTYRGYQQVVIEGETREYYGGTLSELSVDDSQTPQFVFTVQTLAEPDELLTQQTIHGVYRQLQDRVPFAELSYTTDADIHLEQAQSWVDPTFPVTILPPQAGPQYESYTGGLAYGRIRRFTDAQLAEAGPAPFGWQDIVVLEHPPLVLEGVMAASITEARQDVLTHLNVLSALRGTPNASVADAIDVLEPHEGKLVRLEVLPTYYSVREVSVEEAEAHWAQQRPQAELGAPPQWDFVQLRSLDDIAVASAAERTEAVRRFGSKVAGLAVLRSVAPPQHVVRGFGVPMAAYLDFMNGNTWSAPSHEGPTTATYAETISMWLADDTFRSDASLRASWLQALREEMVERGTVDATWLDEIRTQIGTTLGDPATMVRFRSSSNAEDSLSFNGAGLYESVSGCGPDTTQSAVSACDPSRGPKPIDIALKRVWASVWSFGAYEEREYYQLDHRQIGMGVLVNPRFADEQANGVAFTGNPQDPADPRLTINVQRGEVPVVSSTAGLVAELNRVTLGDDGAVVSIDREVESSLVATGDHVLDDAQLSELAALMGQIAEVYPIDGTSPSETTVMLDMEFKLTADGALVFKQVRPFAARPYRPGAGGCN